MTGSLYPALTGSQWALLGLLAGCVVASVGLATVWIVVGRRPRVCWRAAVLLVPLAILPYRDATELWIALMTQAAVVAAVVGGLKAFEGWPSGRIPRFRFTLLDAAMATVLAAVILAGAIRLQLPEHPERWVMVGLGLAVLTLLVTLTVYSFAKVWRKLRPTATPEVARDPAWRTALTHDRTSWLPPLGVALLVLGDGWFLTLMPPRPNHLRSTGYHPNGYDVLASISLPPAPSSDVFALLLPDASCTAYATATEDARQQAVAAMQAPIEPRPHDIPPSEALESFRNLARAFCAEGLVADRQGDLPRATEAYLQCYRLGILLGNSGLLIDRLVGNAIRWEAIRGLRKLTTFPDDSETDIESRLLEIDREQEPLDAVLTRERQYQLWESDWLGRLLMGFGGLWFSSDDLDRFRAADQCKRTAFSIELALGAYCREHGEYPDALGRLTPDYFAEVPLDAFGKAPFRYRRLPNGGYLLYGVGPDRIDQGGDPDDDFLFVGPPRLAR